MSTQEINELAVMAKTDGRAFEDLYATLKPLFPSLVSSYRNKKNLTGFNFDRDDYYSAIGQAMWETVRRYDITRGNFTTVFTMTCTTKMSNVTATNLRQKRFSMEKATISYDALLESGDSPAEEIVEDSPLINLIEQFKEKDEEGEIVDILISTSDKTLRRELLTDYYGEYTARERKKVQRVKERFNKFLTLNGVFI